MNINLNNQNGVKLNTKGKYCPEDITVIPQLQEKTVTPSETQQTAMPDTNYAGLSKVTIGAVQTEEVTVTPAKGQQVLEVTDNKYYKKVTVEAIPDDYIIPSGTIQITENGIIDVSGKANANVNVPSEQPQLHAPTITKDGTIITITDSALNGDFVTGYKLYANNVLISDQTENTANLSALITGYGTYSITAKCKGTKFQDSLESNAVEYIYEELPAVYEVDGETLKITSANYTTIDGGILKLL